MRVVMVAPPSGYRDGVKWPAAGETIDLPEAEALGLISGGAIIYMSLRCSGRLR